MNILNASDLFIFKWLIIWYMNFISKKKRIKKCIIFTEISSAFELAPLQIWWKQTYFIMFSIYIYFCGRLAHIIVHIFFVYIFYKTDFWNWFVFIFIALNFFVFIIIIHHFYIFVVSVLYGYILYSSICFCFFNNLRYMQLLKIYLEFILQRDFREGGFSPKKWLLSFPITIIK